MLRCLGPAGKTGGCPMSHSARFRRRTVGLLRARLPELQLERVQDPRQDKGLRWQLPALLSVVLTAMVAGCTSLREAEQLTTQVSRVVARRLLHIVRRVPDTTLRTALCRLGPEQIRALLHRQIRLAHRRKSLQVTELPIGVVAIDGKSTILPSCDDHFAQRQTAEGGALRGALRTMTCCLISSAACPCIDAIPIPADTNEMAIFQRCVSELRRSYGNLDLFRLVATDAGSCSQDNASFVRSQRLHYLFALKNTQPTLHDEAVRLLGALDDYEAVARSDDHLGGERVVRRNLHITRQMDGYCWEHLRTVLRVQSQTYEHGVLVKSEDRYFVCSLAADRLTNAQWLQLVRRYWMVENGPHFTLDVALHEDDHPWIEASPQGALVVALLRRVAYNLLALFRNVTLRGEANRMMPWKQLIEELRYSLHTACDSELQRRRVHIPAPAAASLSQPVLV
jgi:hypothetical protein